MLTFEVSGPAHDPNKTIIRTAPAQDTPKPKTQTSQAKAKLKAKKSAAQAQNKSPQLKSADNLNKSKVAKKRLASDGKQKWISGENLENKQAKSQKSKYRIIIGVLFGIAITAVLILTFSK